MLLNLQEFAFEGQKTKLAVNVLLTCILQCAPGPAAIRTVCKYSRQTLITDIIFSVLARLSSGDAVA